MLRLPSYLQLNSYGIFYFRIAVPKSLRVVLGRREIKRSLRIDICNLSPLSPTITLWHMPNRFSYMPKSSLLMSLIIKVYFLVIDCNH
jgi:hypothetical protein